MDKHNETYNQQYYATTIASASSIPYTDSAYWGTFFAQIANQIVETFHPKTVLDAGCALGYLVAALRDLGVEAYGVDVSEYAITNVREDIKPYCAVGSLTDTLPVSLPRKYDLVVTIEVLEHLTVEDGKKAIQNLCTLSDRVLFSSTPSDFDDITHINVQQREYWSEIFAKEHFYDAVLCRPTWLTPQAVLYQKGSGDILDIVANYERYIRQIDKKLATFANQDFFAKVYFNFGEGESEDHCQMIPVKFGEHLNQRIFVPTGCKSIRFDPVEGYGCLIRNFCACTDSASLAVLQCNGIRMHDVMLFNTIDPQIYVEALPLYTHWVDINAKIFPQNSTAWIRLCGHVEELIRSDAMKSQKLEEKEQQIQDLRNLSDEQIQNLRNLSDERWMKIAQLENECLAKETQLKEAHDENAELQNRIFDLEKLAETQEKSIKDYGNLVDYERSVSQKQIQEYAAVVDHERAELHHERAELHRVSGVLNAVYASTSWRMTKPFRFVSLVLKKVLVWPVRKVFHSLRHNGIKVTLVKIKNKLTGKQTPVEVPVIEAPQPVEPAPVYVSKIVRNTITGNPVDPIQTVLVDEPVRRLNLVTDTINSDSLLGGVATALIVATEFANKWDCELRIITRNTETNPLNYENIIKISGIQPAKKVSFYSDYDRFNRDIDYKLEISPQDIFFATSWWSAMAIAETTIRKRFFYIIQEVETFFYNYGGERVLCEQVMNNPNIDFIINSGYLNQYFKTHERNIAENSCYFEPAFSKKLYKEKTFEEKERFKLFFYARPNNPRNLYPVGVEFLKKAVEKGILDTEEWDVYCVGQNAPIITFANGAQSINLGQLSWTEYADFLTDVDLGLCLMYTPHPSYPPFDVASSGGVVLSNKMLNKTSFDMCKNVILADLDEDAFMESFKEAVSLAKNKQRRKKNYEENTIPRNWSATLENTIAYMKGKCEDV